MSSRIFSICVVLATILAVGSSASAATPEQINKSIESAKKLLYDTQAGDGTWEGIVDFNKNSLQEGGVTCMCVYALLTAGESEKDPRLAKAIKYVISGDIKGTYSFGFQALALDHMTQTPEVQKALKKVAKHLLEGGTRKGLPGLYFYNSATTGDTFDLSNSQYGALGMWACADAGIELPDQFWVDLKKSWQEQAQKDGGWQYAPGPDYHTTNSMTAAGIATLSIADDQLSFKSAGECRGNINDPFIDKGMTWMSTRMKDIEDLYVWYGIERIGIATGYKYIGDVDWFKKGADVLVKMQQRDGSWDYHKSAQVGTSYAMLFLVRGKAPIVMNKLRYMKTPGDPNSIDGNWNERNRDAAGAAKFIGDQLEGFMNWQVVTLNIDPDEFHDSPILYIAGNEPLKFTPEEEAKLRKFIEAGGMILGNADCATPAFTESFKSLCKRLVDGQYEFRPLPADHPIFNHQQFAASKWKTKMGLDGMSNGVRELAILIPTADPSRAWHSKQFKNKRDMFELIADIYLYSVDRQNISQKGVTYIVKADPKITTSSTIKLARLQYEGNWDPEPGSWRRLSAVLQNDFKVGLSVTPVKVGTGKLTGFAIAHLTGTTAFKLDDASREEIKKFVSTGGTLIIDAAGGSTAFADAAEKELGTIFPTESGQLEATVPLGSPIFGDMTVFSDFKYRSFARSAGKVAARGPMIRAIQMNGRAAVIFSREDISAGMVGEDVDGVIGYAPESATRLMANLVQSAAAHTSTTRPAAATTQNKAP